MAQGLSEAVELCAFSSDEHDSVDGQDDALVVGDHAKPALLQMSLDDLSDVSDDAEDVGTRSSAQLGHASQWDDEVRSVLDGCSTASVVVAHGTQTPADRCKTLSTATKSEPEPEPEVGPEPEPGAKDVVQGTPEMFERILRQKKEAEMQLAKAKPRALRFPRAAKPGRRMSFSRSPSPRSAAESPGTSPTGSVKRRLGNPFSTDSTSSSS